MEAESLAATLIGPQGEVRGRELAIGPGAKIGRYLLLDTLGQGGMGVVCAAYDPELDRKVAIKILLPGRRRERAHARLLREAQALARLSHVNVVAVHDVGSHEGQVFVAMEFIAGETLATVIAGGASGREELLRLFRGAGEGLAAAHRAGLVHRDFKPENVMVDAEGRARVVDFGLAHAAHEAAAEQSRDDVELRGEDRLTMTGALMGTPAYMAPEQFSGGPTDARTDIFAFCVALYEALYAERPFAGDSLATLAVAVLGGQVREPPKGARVSPRLRRVLLRGLAAAPGSRYPDMESLLADLDRALAAPRRRRLLAAGLSVPLVGALVGLAFAGDDRAALCRGDAAQAPRIWTASARAQGERAFAASGLAYADDAWTRAAAAIDVWVAQWQRARSQACDEALVDREHSEHLLERRLACFDRQLSALAGVVELAADARPTVVMRIGDAVAELPPVTACSPAELLDARDRPEPPSAAIAAEVADVQRRLSAAQARFRVTEGDDALAQLDALLVEARGLGYGPLVAEVSEQAAFGHRRLGNLDVAEERFLEALSAAESSGDARHLASVTPDWARFLVDERSAVVEAEHACRRSEALLERIGGSPAIEIQLHLARAQVVNQRSLESAIAELRAALALAERTFGADDLRLAEIHNTLGGRLNSVDDAAAARHVERARGILELQLGPRHPSLARVYRNLGHLAIEREDYVAAERYFREAIARFELLAPDHPNIGALTNSLALALDYRGEPNAARVEYQRALEHLERTLGEEHSSTVLARIAVSSAARRVGDLDVALREIELAATIQRRRQGIHDPTAAFAYVKWLQLHLERGELQAAGEIGELLLSVRERIAGDDGVEWMIPSLGMGIAELREAEGRDEEALALAEESLAAAVDSAHDYRRAKPRFIVARLLVATGGDRERARALAAAARASWGYWPRYYRRELQRLDAWREESGLE
ncbi:MAG: serine/threonine-protein kinase [Nannocystaceae bacterium]